MSAEGPIWEQNQVVKTRILIAFAAALFMGFALLSASLVPITYALGTAKGGVMAVALFETALLQFAAACVLVARTSSWRLVSDENLALLLSPVAFLAALPLAAYFAISPPAAALIALGLGLLPTGLFLAFDRRTSTAAAGAQVSSEESPS